MSDPSSPASSAAGLPADLQRVALAMSLLWTYRPRTAVHRLLGLLQLRRGDGRAFTPADVKQAQEGLRERGLLEDAGLREGVARLVDGLRIPLYRELLESRGGPALRAALYELESYQPGHRTYAYYWPVYDPGATIGLVRVALFSGAPTQELQAMADAIARSSSWEAVLMDAAFAGFDGASFARIEPTWRDHLLYQAASEITWYWRPELLPACDWALAEVERDPAAVSGPLRLGLAGLLLHRGETAGVCALLAGVDNGAADGLAAGLLVQAGRWGEAQAAFEAALKRRGEEVRARKRVLPASLAWLYPLSLLAQQTPTHLELARKFCQGEAGKRDPSPKEGWGRWVHAVAVRLGDTTLTADAFGLSPRQGLAPHMDDLWGLVLAAWLGRDRVARSAPARFAAELNAFAKGLRERLEHCKLAWLAGQVEGAVAVLGGAAPPERFFVTSPGEQWREVLAALEALGTQPEAAADAGPATRIIWTLSLGPNGELREIRPLEQKRGVRGWTKPRVMSLTRVAGDDELPPWDVKVTRALRPDRSYANRFFIDRPAAIAALVGHPAVSLADDPGHLLDLVEGTPELEVVRQGERYLLRVTPELRGETDVIERYFQTNEERREAEALRLITLVQESPQRLRLIRFTPAQRRAAQLLSGQFSVPATAQAPLQQTLRALSVHFQVQADHARAAQEVTAETRLRAELSPAGLGLRLRLVAAPLGPEGPRLAPGFGRARLMIAVGGESLGTRRDLSAERAALGEVLDALPFLDEPSGEGGAPEWLVDNPEDALSLVETLPTLAAILALDWPKGKPLRVMTLDAPQVAVGIQDQRDWFRLSGRVALDEGRVLELSALLEAAGNRSRFLPMGEGLFVALTRSLKQRLAELAAVAELDREGARAPQAAAAWLHEALEGVSLKADAGFTRALARLQAAQEQSFAPSKGLQAELRPYQEDGYLWAMRLAAAGLGGCLADDMGLGKTVQALGVLLARGSGGAALVVAPTSVCGNWLAEAARFAPSLRVQIYGEGEREALVAGAGPMEVVVVSYGLLQQAPGVCTKRLGNT